MKIAHIDAVRKSVAPNDVAVLTDIFRTAAGKPPGVPAQRYRANHKDWHDAITRLANERNFLQQQGANYELRVFALPLIDDQRARTILEIIEAIFQRMKLVYDKHLSEPRPLGEIIEGVSGNEVDILAALYFMIDAHSVTAGHTNGFPYCENPQFSVAESVILYPGFGRILDEFYEWHITNPRRLADTWLNSHPFSRPTDDKGFFTATDAAVPPKWFDQLDKEKQALITEIDAALRAGSMALPVMGLRALIESVIRDHIDEPGQDGLKDRLSGFKKKGFVTDQQALTIYSVIDVGNAAAHRAHFPSEAGLETCVGVVKNMMELIYILKPRMDAVAANTPKKEPSPPAVKDGKSRI